MAPLAPQHQSPRIVIKQGTKPQVIRLDSLDSSVFSAGNDSWEGSISSELTVPSPTMATTEELPKATASTGTDAQALKELVREILKQERLEIQRQTNGADGIDGLTSRFLASYITELEKKVATLEQKDKKAEDKDKKSAKTDPVKNGESGNEPKGNKLVVKRLRKETSSATAVPDQGDASDSTGKDGGGGDGKHILTVTRDVEKNNQKTLEIRSQQVIQILRKIVRYYPGQALGGNMVSFVDPFMLLFHNRRKIVEEVEKLELDAETKLHLEHVLDFMRKECPEVSSELDALEEDEERSVISFANSWLIFAPGNIVYSTQESEDKDESEKAKVVVSSPEGEKRAYMVEELSGLEIEKLSSGREIRTSLKLRCWSMDFDGYRFGRTYTELYVRPFNGSREISQLEVVPAKYADPKIEDLLIARGRSFWELKERDSRFRSYTGKAWSKTTLADTLRVVVDHAAYSKSGNEGIRIEGVPFLQQDQVHCPCSDCKEKRETARINFERLDRVSPYAKYNSIEPDSEPDDLTLLLCPDRAYAFSLRDKTWKPVKLRDLTFVEFRKKAFDKLVMKKEYKATVQALVSTYTSDKNKFRDIIEAKGRGLVLLLHGPPGTGKTLTAECVADEYQRPLYMVTCGDLGTEPWELEQNLRRIFKDATTWNAVLLLDEADIFLQMRDYKDIKRNALVSVFLRELEYFDGILFLTTNRVGAIDEAFQSRIHVTLGLPVLDEDSRRDIWKIFIKDLGGIHKDSRKDLLKHVNAKLGKCSLNGRQIRNCVRTALALANQANEPISTRHLDDVVKMGEEFSEYMKSLQKMDAEEYQAAMGNRLASWKPKD